MEIFAVIDTNVLVSALYKKDSIPYKVLQKVFDGTVTPIIHEKILTEYWEVLSREKFRFPREIVQNTVEGFLYRGIKLEGIPAPKDEPLPDPKDIIFYEVTLDANQKVDTYLVTGNTKHFPIKPFVVTPAQMLEIIEKNQ